MRTRSQRARQLRFIQQALGPGTAARGEHVLRICENHSANNITAFWDKRRAIFADIAETKWGRVNQVVPKLEVALTNHMSTRGVSQASTQPNAIHTQQPDDLSQLYGHKSTQLP